METNEQKAKAYDEVLERTKEMYAHTANGYAKHIMEQIFPELKESNSERIRREMIEFLKQKRQETYVPYEWTEWLKEQKADWSEEDEKMLNNLHSWMKEFGGAEEYTEKVYQWIKGLLEKQGEQKSTDKVEPKFNTYEYPAMNRRQNPAWSEEDEAYRVYIIVKLEPHITDGDFTDVQNWLKSVKNRLKKIN